MAAAVRLDYGANSGNTDLREGLVNDRRLELARAFVRLGYGDALVDGDGAFRSLEFLTEELTTSEVQELVRMLTEESGYFDGAAVAEAMTPFRGRVSSWQFGRESSPVLIVKLPHWTAQRENADKGTTSTRISDSEHDALVEQLATGFDAVGAGEVGPTGTGRNVRIWWD